MKVRRGGEDIRIENLIISKPTQADIKAAYRVFEASIPDAYEKEGLGLLKEDIHREIEHKKHLLDASMSSTDSKPYFLLAKHEETVVGTISFAPCSEDIKKCIGNQFDGISELGSLYILPSFQGQGAGSALIHTLLTYLSEQGIEQFCLDSGYKRAQKKWLRKFGEPYKVVKDYWGPGFDHMIWLCKVHDVN